MVRGGNNRIRSDDDFCVMSLLSSAVDCRRPSSSATDCIGVGWGARDQYTTKVVAGGGSCLGASECGAASQ